MQIQGDGLKTTAMGLRIVGVGMLAVGLIAVLMTLSELWGLLDDDKRVVQVASQIEQHSGINSTLRSLFPNRSLKKSEKPVTAASVEREEGEDSAERNDGISEESSLEEDKLIDVAYFFAWFVVIVVISAIARLSIIICMSGVKLLRYEPEDERFKQILRELVEEVRERKNEIS